MKKRIFSILVIVCVSFAAVLNISLTKSTNQKILLSMSDIQNIAFAEVTIIPAKDNVDAPEECSTKKKVKVEAGLDKNGQMTFKYETINVTGMQNACLKENGKTCNAYACYSND